MPSQQPSLSSTMQTALPNNLFRLGARLSGVVEKVQVVEKRRLHEVRCRSYARHGNPVAWRNLHGVPFSGRYSHFMSLSPLTRARIERDVVRDINEYPEEWRMSPVAEAIEERGPKSNLVLNQGLDLIVGGTTNTSWVSYYAIVGTGTTPPSSADTAMGSEVKRAGPSLTGAGNCGSTYGSYYQTNRRTHDFSEETSNQNYTELGFSHASSGNLFSRLLISGGTVSVLIGQALRTVYDLTTSIGSVTGSGTLNIGEWGEVGMDYGVCVPYLPEVNPSSSGWNTTTTPFSPQGGGLSCRALSGDFTFSYGNVPSGASVVGPAYNGAWGAYTAGTFTRTHTWSTYWSASSWNSTAVRGFGYGRFDQYGTYNYAIKFNSNQTKTSLQKLKPAGLILTYSA